MRDGSIPLPWSVRGRSRRDRVAQVAEHHLDGVARLPEDERRHPGRDEVGREHHRLLHVARADPELLVDDGRIEEEKAPIAARGAALADELDVVLRDAEEARGVLARVADRGRGPEDPRVGPVEAGDAHEAPQDVRHVRPEDAAVRVDLVDDDVAQVLQRARPRRRGAEGCPCAACPGS